MVIKTNFPFRGNNQFSGLSVEERFWQKVDKQSIDECWNWIGSINNKGYGLIGDGNKKLILSHRYSWIFHFGEIPDGVLVLHKCDNRICVNPSHLFLGTDKDNAIDREQKGRGRNSVGENSGANKLTWKEVQEIRDKHYKVSYSSLSKEYKVSRSTIHGILLRKSWKEEYVSS